MIELFEALKAFLEVPLIQLGAGIIFLGVVIYFSKKIFS